MTSTRPLVSVCVPTRDRGSLLRDALESALTADVPDMEIVVVDDASDDDTAAVVAALDDRRIVYRRNPKRLGIAASRNVCLETARGSFFAWLDDDDAYLPGGLAHQIEILEREPDVAMVHGDVEVVDADGRPAPAWRTPFDGDRIEPGIAAFEDLILENYVNAPTVVTRASLHRALGRYAGLLGDRAEDWDAWLGLALQGDVAYVSRKIARYRRHPGSASASRTFTIEWLESETRVVRRALQRGRGRVPSISRTRERAYAALAWRHLSAAGDALVRGHRTTAARAAYRAMRLAPSHACELSIAADHAERGDEHRFHRTARAVLRDMAEALDGTRVGATVRDSIASTEAWAAERTEVARCVRAVVPEGARISAIDKWDPSFLHEAGREGWHFPDLALAPDGYPRDASDAIAHLEAQRARGAEYLVVPRAALWWMDHYAEFGLHLETRCDRVWGDEVCTIYRIEHPREAVA